MIEITKGQEVYIVKKYNLPGWFDKSNGIALAFYH